MVNLQHLHCCPFLLIHAFSLPPLAYKRRPGHPIPPHTSSQAIFLSFSSPTVQRNSIHSACQFCPAATPPVHSLVPDDLATKMLPIFSSRCSHVPHNISKNRRKRNWDATRITLFMAAASCLHAFCAHDWDSNSVYSLFWYHLDASTTP